MNKVHRTSDDKQEMILDLSEIQTPYEDFQMSLFDPCAGGIDLSTGTKPAHFEEIKEVNVNVDQKPR